MFVDGDYWHCRILVDHGLAALKRKLRTPSRDYWLAKFRSRVARDVAITEELRSMGWFVIRLWESDVKADLDGNANKLASTIRRRARVQERQRSNERR